LYCLVNRNEQEVGFAIRKSGLLRTHIFAVTKLVWDDHGYENCKASFAESLKR